MIIALVTSTKFADTFRDQFNAGLRTQGWGADDPDNLPSNGNVVILTYEARGNYDDGNGAGGARQELYQAVKAFDANPEVELIVAAGGLVSAHAAWRECRSKPFVVLCGAAPNFNPPNPHFRGGVNLDMVGYTVDRHDKLCQMLNISNPNKVCLVWNSNSKMGKEEKRIWTNDNHWPLEERVKKNRDNAIEDAFSKAAKAGAEGIVVSGDPYFTSQKDTVVAAANLSGLKVCYPFEIFGSAIPPPQSGRSMWLGPDLGTAYNLVGQKVGEVLTALKDGKSAPDTGLDKVPTKPPVVFRKNASQKARSKVAKRKAKKPAAKAAKKGGKKARKKARKKRR